MTKTLIKFEYTKIKPIPNINKMILSMILKQHWFIDFLFPSLKRSQKVSLTSYSREKRHKFAGLESCCCSPLRHTPCSAPQLFCSHVHPPPQSKRAARCAGTYWDSQSNPAYRSPETGRQGWFMFTMTPSSKCKCVLKGLKHKCQQCEEWYIRTSGMDNVCSSPISTLLTTAILNDSIPTNTATCRWESKEKTKNWTGGWTRICTSLPCLSKLVDQCHGFNSH